MQSRWLTYMSVVSTLCSPECCACPVCFLAAADPAAGTGILLVTHLTCFIFESYCHPTITQSGIVRTLDLDLLEINRSSLNKM